MPDPTREPVDWRSTNAGHLVVQLESLRSAVASMLDVLPFGPLQDDGFCRVCARYDGHADDCEWNVMALLAGEGTTQPDRDAAIDNAVEAADGEMAQGRANFAEWRRLFLAELSEQGYEIRASGEGTAPQVPAEVLWEGETGYFAVDDFTDSHVDHLTLGVPPGTRVRVVAADDAPQEGDEQ